MAGALPAFEDNGRMQKETETARAHLGDILTTAASMSAFYI